MDNLELHTDGSSLWVEDPDGTTVLEYDSLPLGIDELLSDLAAL